MKGTWAREFSTVCMQNLQVRDQATSSRRSMALSQGYLVPYRITIGPYKPQRHNCTLPQQVSGSGIQNWSSFLQNLTWYLLSENVKLCHQSSDNERSDAELIVLVSVLSAHFHRNIAIWDLTWIVWIPSIIFSKN